MDESIMSTKIGKRDDKCLIYYFQDKLDLPEIVFEVLNKATETQKLYGVTSSRLTTEHKLKYDTDLQSVLGNKNIIEKGVIDNNKDILCRVVQTEFQFIQKLMLLTYATGDQIIKYVEDRQNDMLDNYEVWKFQEQDLYLITLSHRRYLIIRVDTSDYIDELNINNYQAVQQFMKEFYNIDQPDQMNYEIGCILSDSKIQYAHEYQFDRKYQIDVNDVLLHQDLKDYINEQLLMAPIFNKDTLSFDWNNQNKINLKKLPSEGIQQQ